MNPEYKKLYRSRNNRMVGGVCAGLGAYFGIDPTLVRLAFVLATVFGLGGTIILYIILLLIVPEEPITTVTTYATTTTQPAPSTEQSTEASVVQEPVRGPIHGADIYDAPVPPASASGGETITGGETSAGEVVGE